VEPKRGVVGRKRGRRGRIGEEKKDRMRGRGACFSKPRYQIHMTSVETKGLWWVDEREGKDYKTG